MAVRRAKVQTVHGIKRIKERTELTKRGEALKLIKLASKHGASPHQFIKAKRLHNYLLSRAGFNKRVKLYLGYVYIFNGGSDRLITMYPLPERYKEDYKKYA